jgi:Flp pilus assembly protein TadB
MRHVSWPRIELMADLDSRTAEANEPPSPAERLETDAAYAAAAGLSAVDVTAVVLLGLLICPPLAILVVLVAGPLLVIALFLGLLYAVISIPYLLVHRLRNHHGDHLSLFAHRLRHTVRALIDLAPHRIVAAARAGSPSGSDRSTHGTLRRG